MTTQLNYTVNYPTATPGNENFYINISVENRTSSTVSLEALQIYLPIGDGANDLTSVDDKSSINTTTSINWPSPTIQTDGSGANVEVTFACNQKTPYVMKSGGSAVSFSLKNITVNNMTGIANCKLVEFTVPYVTNSEYDFSISKPITPPDKLSFTANTYSINAGDTVVFTWAGPSGWIYTITHDGIQDCSTTQNEGSVVLSLCHTTVVTLQRTQTDQTPPTPLQITITVTPKISLTGTVQPTQKDLYQLALDWTSSGAMSVYGSWSSEALALSGSQIVGLSYADAQSKSCADYILTATGSDTEASCPCAIAPPVINSFTPELSLDATGQYYMILKWDVSGAFYVEGSWITPDSAPFNPSDQSAVIDAPFASEYTITAYVLSDAKTTKTLQMADFFPAPVIQQFSFVVDGDSLVVNWEVLSPNAPVYSLCGSWQPASSPSLPLTGSLTFNRPLAPIYTLTVEGLVANQSMTRSINTDILWRQASTVESPFNTPFCINFTDNQTYLVGYQWGVGLDESWSGVGCYSTSEGILSLFSPGDDAQITSMAITPNLEYILILENDPMDGHSYVRGYDLKSFTQTDPQPVTECYLPYTFPGAPITPIVITSDNSSVYVAYLYYLAKVDLTQAYSLPNTLELCSTKGYESPEPRGIAITQNGDYVLIVFGNGYVITVDVASFNQLNTIAVGQNPCAIAITPNNQYALVTCSGDDTVWVIGLSSFSVTATLAVGAKPESLAITPDGNYVFVGNTDSDTVSVLDATKLTVVQTLQVGGGSKSIAFTPDSRCAFVSANNTVSVIAVDGLFVVQTFNLAETGPLAVSPDGKSLYMAGFSNNYQFVNTN